MNIALVGFTNSYNDQRWLEMAGARVAEHDPALAWASARRTVFDLRGENGLNFLDDRGEYGMVVLKKQNETVGETNESMSHKSRNLDGS